MNTIIGTIVEAGTDDDGVTRLIIHTEPQELAKLKTLPLYRPALITIEAAPEPVEHGVDCEKVDHKGREYGHDANYDRPYELDGGQYCGRCHKAL